ncbi:MAG: ABC transporter permease subunit [Candidatus Poribacteria bacterium]|nr:ABC transporter permease subunit [Candidatus Poribacteria bacterium]
MWHITKRELYDNLNSLRFALTTVLLLALMVTNAVRYIREHPKRVQKYRDAVAESMNRLTAHADASLYTLAQQGPGTLYKQPSPLHFCAEGGETFLPDRVDSSYYTERFWRLRYPDVNINMMNVGPDVSQVDWTFIIGYILSLVALIFTFDAISGEREHGTLRLMLANSIPRRTVLIGKFLGALISTTIPFMLAVLVNLLILSTASAVHLNIQAWGRLGIIFCIALLYTCLFLALGLLVSARVQQSAVSLLILLLTWVTFVVFMPSTLASLASGFSSSMSRDEYDERYGQSDAELRRTWQRSWYWADKSELDERTLTKIGEWHTKTAVREERLNAGYVTFKINQVQRARAITSISPAVLLQHLLESFAGTGLDRHQQFIENVQRYAREYREFVVDMDRSDPESLHIMGVREGMSQKPINPEAVPKFEDTRNLSKDFNTAATELLLLTLFVVVLLAGAYLAFVRVEI